jgi:hypothetical protein
MPAATRMTMMKQQRKVMTDIKTMVLKDPKWDLANFTHPVCIVNA